MPVPKYEIRYMNNKIKVTVSLVTLVLIIFVINNLKNKGGAYAEHVITKSDGDLEIQRSSMIIEDLTDSQIIEQSLSQLKQNPIFETTRPLPFYGQVRDRTDVPISNAEVVFAWNEKGYPDYRKQSVFSDENGNFVLSKGIATGKFISIVEIIKEGYFWSPDYFQSSFEYGNANAKHFHIPRSSEPVKFTMVKKASLSPMYSWQLSKVLKQNDKVKFPLTNNKKSAALELSSDFLNASADSNFSWQTRLTGLNGTQLQILEGKKEIDFYPFAPESGYENEVTVGYLESDDDWDNQKQFVVYYKTASGGYGIAKVVTRIRTQNFPDNVVQIKYRYSQDSPNLVYDHSLRLRN